MLRTILNLGPRAKFAGLAILLVRTFCIAQGSQVVELKDNWSLVSEDRVTESGSRISSLAFETGGWYPIRSMPGTVLSILQDDGVYPNLFYGKNLLTEVPQDLWQKRWWYRTVFQVPRGPITFWLDFPGINYRAEIWLNGERLATDRQVVGMYVDHRFNVTGLIRPGQSNALAVEVTPERLIQDVNGVEMADSWQDWINWKYLGYQGPVDIKNVDTSGLVVRYVPPDGSDSLGDVSTIAAITAATPTTESIQATVTVHGNAVTQGKALYWHDGVFLGEAPVNGLGISRIEAKRPFGGISFVADRNAGIWKPVYLYMTGPVALSDALVDAELPLPSTDSAKLTLYLKLTNGSSADVDGVLLGTITRPGKPSISLRQSVTVRAGQAREIEFNSSAYPQLIVRNPDLWWPYTMGDPALYRLNLKFVKNRRILDTKEIRFGIRQVTQLRDDDEKSESLGRGGNFYLQINGKNFLIRGAAYTPDLLYQYSPGREEAAIRYAKDMGLNMLRWESKISSEHIVDLADEQGIPLMFGWMCCNQWEKWDQWNDEDRRVVLESLNSQILMLRSHASVFIWANGSDGLPPLSLRNQYHSILAGLHWQNAIVDSAASHGPNDLWDGIRMRGPYVWRPPSYWFSNRYVGAEGACAEQGDNENIPPLESLKRFIPPNSLWPINDDWYFHAGAIYGDNQFSNTQLALNRRYGSSSSAQEFAEKAQLGLYENTRAQFEDYAANGWANHKMTLYWMLNSQWPSFFGHLYDYYLKPGGAYFGAKQGLRPLTIVFDYFATGDHTHARIRVVNQTLSNQNNLKIRVRIYDLYGTIRFERSAHEISAPAQSSIEAMTLPAPLDITSTYFIRCELFTGSGEKISDNTYWQSTTLDDFGDESNDLEFSLSQTSWANLSALKTLPRTPVNALASLKTVKGEERIQISVENPSRHIAFFERIEVTDGRDGLEILPILYSQNYLTVFPGETEYVTATYSGASWQAHKLWLRISGYNTPEQLQPVQ